MDDLNDRLKELGKVVSETSDRLAEPAAVAAARRRWLESPQALARPSGRRRQPALLSAAACALFAAIVLFAVRRPSTVSFAVGSPPVHGTVGEWIAAGGGAPSVVRFSEGTSLTLAPRAKIRVTETTPHGANVLLEQGSVEAAVVHIGADTQWALRAGPFDVRVTGTRFEASWDPIAETFELSMREGSVIVQGPLLPSDHPLVAGEQLRVSVRMGAMERHAAQLNATTPTATAYAEPAAPAPPQEPSAIESPPVASPTVDAPAAPRPPAALAPGAASTADRAPSWRDLAIAGKYKDAFDAAERVGFAQELERVSASELSTLADIARFARRPAQARDALLAQRRRFGARGQSAFLIGKIAADQQGNAAEAIRWFETYLREEPGGSLVEQSLGRILELKKGDAAAAHLAAERYLARYPNGAYAALARSFLSP
jgi:transmembrane sensor